MERDSIGSFLNKIANCVPGISLDCVVFGYQQGSLHVLLLKYRNTEAWALPGGFLPRNAEMDDAVSVILEERTKVGGIFMDQFHTFSSLDRNWDFNELSRSTFQQVSANWSARERSILEPWFRQRFISTAYVALVDPGKVVPKPDFTSEECTWVPVQHLPPLVLDHREMIDKALQHVRTQVNFFPVGRSLLGEKFTLGDLRSLYEVILGKKLDRGNFQRKIMKLNMLTRHEKLMTGAQNKAPYLYSIDDRVYDQLLEDGIGFS